MMNGCICCNVRGDLIPVVKRLLARKDQFVRLPGCVDVLSIILVLNRCDRRHAVSKNWSSQVKCSSSHPSFEHVASVSVPPHARAC
jgi:hypothetical protein